MTERLTPEREAQIRQPRTRRLDWAPQVYEEWDDERADLLAELDAVRAELGAARANLRSGLVEMNVAWASAYAAKRPLATGREDDPPTVYGPGPTVPNCIYCGGDVVEARRMELREMKSWLLEKEAATTRADAAERERDEAVATAAMWSDNAKGFV